MGPLGTLYRDLLFFQGYVADPALLRDLQRDAAAPPAGASTPAREPLPALPAAPLGARP